MSKLRQPVPRFGFLCIRIVPVAKSAPKPVGHTIALTGKREGKQGRRLIYRREWRIIREEGSTNQMPDLYPWLRTTADLAAYLAASDGPLTLFLGAGASLSSGAPTTSQVQGALIASTAGRLQGADGVRTGVHRVTHHEKLVTIGPLFEKVVPYVGYRCLAAMARTRPVIVVNLNWDNAVEDACALLDVPCRSWDLEDGFQAIEEAVAGLGVGVVCIHLHGRLVTNGEIRFGCLETLRFDQHQRALLRRLLAHPTVVAGASLRGDSDVTDLIDEAGAEQHRAESSAARPIWLLSREARTTGEDSATLGLLRARTSDLNLVEDANADFDLLMLQLLAGQSRCSLDSTAERNPHLSLPRLAETVLPRAGLLRPLLNAAVTVLVGEPYLGKTTAAHLIATWRHLCGGPQGEVRTFERPHQCIHALGISEAMLDTAVLVLEDPFGAGEAFEANPGFLAELERVAESGTTFPIVVTTRGSHWARATGNRALHRSIQVAPSSPAAWYDPQDLLRLTDSVTPANVLEAIHTHQLNTPARVRYALKRPHGVNGDRTDQDVVADKKAFLANAPDAAKLLGLVRLQQLSNDPRPLAGLLEQLHLSTTAEWSDAPGRATRTAGMLREYVLDEVLFGRLTHSSDADAIDALLRDPNEPLMAELVRVGSTASWVEEALSLWHTLRSVEASEAVRVGKVREAQQREWGPALLAAASEPAEVLIRLRRETLDFWSLCDLMYEVVRLWPNLRHSRDAQDALREVLADRDRMGAYAVLEAALFLQRATHPEVWSRLEAALWDLVRPGEPFSFEAALIFDGLMWRPAPGLDAADWLNHLLAACPPDSPLEGALSFVSLYHPDGRPLLAQRGSRDPALPANSLGREQAAEFNRMMAWHFLHQSRKRAIIHRRDFGAEHLACLRRSLHEKRSSTEGDTLSTAMLGRLAQWPEHAGWGFHLGLNLHARGKAEGLTGAMQALIAACPPADPAVVAAVMTYEPPPELVMPLQRYFGVPGNREALLDALASGLQIGETHAAYPRFLYLRNPFALHRLLRWQWERLERLGVDCADGPALLQRLRNVAPTVATKYRADRRHLEYVLSRVERGDLRPLEGAAVARGSVPDPYLAVLTAAVRLRQEAERSRSLFDGEL